MANEEHLAMLKRGVHVWNKWRDANPDVMPNLSEANLTDAKLNRVNLAGAYLNRTNLHMASLSHASLRKAILSHANLSYADLSRADLTEADLLMATLSSANLAGAILAQARLGGAAINHADLTGANLVHAGLSRANLIGAKLVGADLREAFLMAATLIETQLSGAILSGAHVYGVSAWGLDLSNVKEQANLRITPPHEPEITVDSLEVAQFVYLMLHNEKIRDVLHTIGKRGVLILGRFTPERKAILDAIREELRRLGFVPMMFDFEKVEQRDFTETIKTLAGLSRLIIADITKPRSAPLELQATVPDHMVPFVPILQEDEEPFSMFQDLQNKYDWVLDVLEYDSAANLVNVFEQAVIRPALRCEDRLLARKTQAIRTHHVRDYTELRGMAEPPP